VFEGLEQGVFANAVSTAQYECVIGLVARLLNTMCEPPHDVVNVLTEETLHMINPPDRLLLLANGSLRRYVEVETRATELSHPTAAGY
jgi:hypothetical protein